MAWDSTRPVPWRRLVREWAIYAGIMAVIFALFFRDSGMAGAIVGLVLSLPLYLGLGFVLAKLGYQRQRLRTPASTSAPTPSSSDGAARPRPAPTRRTGGSSRPSSSRRRR